LSVEKRFSPGRTRHIIRYHKEQAAVYRRNIAKRISLLARRAILPNVMIVVFAA
jgi:hypothetical protein